MAKTYRVLLLFALQFWLFAKGQDTCTGDSYDVYYSLADADGMTFFMESVGPVTEGSPPSTLVKVVSVDPDETYQSIIGFGAALSGSAAELIYYSSEKEDILRNLFDRETGIGINYLRLPMGGSDFQSGFPYTYNDLSNGETDYPLDQFSTEGDLEFIVPLLLEILAYNPDVQILAVPWSGPAWMKTSQDLYWGSLIDTEDMLNTYANYFVRFLQDYESYGVPVSAISIQNEPGHEAFTYPTMTMSADQMTRFVNVLGPKLQAAGFADVSVQIYDHNWDETWYPISILDDAQARQYVSGSAIHCYRGNSGDTILVHDAHPDKDIYFTECAGGEWDTNWADNLVWHGYTLFVNQTRQYARMVLYWNIALDQDHGPKWEQDAGCADCRGVVTLDRDSGQLISTNIEGVILTHFNRFVRRGAVRVGSTERIIDSEGQTRDVDDVANVAYVNPDGQIVVQIVSGWNHDWQNNNPISVQLGEDYYTVDWSHIPGVGSDDNKQFMYTLITFVQQCE